ncbi:MAG: hypothetical protein LBG87_07415 [Spirochaetaceae bacterium]|jgi:hypothetical protein|nr:hypothetical protein [Spirochaetaceae bacterium]
MKKGNKSDTRGKEDNVRLIYAYHRESGGTAGLCMGKAGLENRKKKKIFLI